MKILLVHYEWPGITDCGGSGRIARELRRRLQARGHAVPLVTDIADGHYLTFPARLHREVGRAIEREDPDIVLSHSTIPTAVGLGRLCDRHDVPLVVKTMGSDVHNPSRFQRIRPLLDRVNARVFDSADRIVTQSGAIAAHIPDAFDAKVSKIPNAIDPDAWEWRRHRTHAPVRVVTVARLQPVKNIAGGVRAVQRLRGAGYDATYRVAGDGPERDALEREFGDRPWVEFIGWVDDVQAQYDWADLFLLPSHHESFGLVLCEAIASGLPVVTTDTGGQVEVLEPGATDGRPVGAVAAPEPDALAGAMAAVLDDYGRYQSNTQAYVATHYSLGGMVTDYERLFREVVDDAATTAPGRTSAD